VLNVFTVDLEDWYCAHALEGAVQRETWCSLPSRVRHGTEILLDLLSAHGVEATFFVLGHVAEREPALIRAVAEAGHEIATHGYSHRHLAESSPEEFRHDLDRSIETLESIVDVPVHGHRAPTFSVTRSTASWALPIVRARGLTYDSSIVPMAQHPSYGIADAPLEVFETIPGLIEVPISVATFGPVRLPATGGGYFRHLPYAATAWLAHRCNSQGRPLVFYIHPWELDPDQPRLTLPLLQRFRQYHGIRGVRAKLTRLLRDFSFTSMRRLLAHPLPIAYQTAEISSVREAVHIARG